MITFKLGDLVAWTTQSGGVTRTKMGKVYAVIPENGRSGLKNSGLPRDHESYLVNACVTNGSSKQLTRNKKYWPRITALTVASKAMQDSVQIRKLRAKG